MDVLKPNIVNISGRCYRVNNIDFNPSFSSEKEDKDLGSYHEYDDFDDDFLLDDNDESRNLIIESTSAGALKTEFHLPRQYYSAIIGHKGALRKRLELETSVSIKIPRLGTTGNIVIIGKDPNNIRRAYSRIRLIVEKFRGNQPFTHFISIRCTSEEIKANFLTFKKSVLENYKTFGISETIFQSPEKIHLTVAVLTLFDTVERSKARDVLEECRDIFILPLLEGKMLQLSLKGLEIMNDDPSNVSVLYAKVKSNDDDLLQKLVDGVNSFFENAGLLNKQFEKVKLHATLMNTVFDKSHETEMETDNKKKKTFDATKILRELGDFEFGRTFFKGFDLSVRFSTASDGYYQFSSAVNFTSCKS